jgi:hypothetical protein
MTYADRVRDYLWSIAPDGATNSALARQLRIRSQQIVYMLTQQLLHAGPIGGERSGSRWIFHAADPGGVRPTSAADASPAAHFKVLAGRVLAAHYSIVLVPAPVPGVRKRFDFVSPDRQVVGDAHYLTNVHSVMLPLAKFSTISENVWLLEKTGAATPFTGFRE